MIVDPNLQSFKIDQVIGNNMETASKKINNTTYYLLYITQLAKNKIAASPVSMIEINCFNQWENILNNNNLMWLKNEQGIFPTLIINSNKKAQLKNHIHLIVKKYQSNIFPKAKNEENNLKKTDFEFECFDNRIIEMNKEEEKNTHEFFKNFLDEHINEFKEKTTNIIKENENNNKENEKHCIIF